MKREAMVHFLKRAVRGNSIACSTAGYPVLILEKEQVRVQLSRRLIRA